MKTEAVTRVFGTKVAIADFLGISKQAVSDWGDEVPPLRQYELRERRPTIDQEIAALPQEEGV